MLHSSFSVKIKNKQLVHTYPILDPQQIPPSPKTPSEPQNGEKSISCTHEPEKWQQWSIHWAYDNE